MEEKYCPTQSGVITGYKPQYRDKSSSGEWKAVPTKGTLPPKGIPGPRMGGGILGTIGLSGYSQAKALAWLFAAYYESGGKYIDVRVEAYEVKYDIKAKAIKGKEDEKDTYNYFCLCVGFKYDRNSCLCC